MGYYVTWENGRAYVADEDEDVSAQMAAGEVICWVGKPADKPLREPVDWSGWTDLGYTDEGFVFDRYGARQFGDCPELLGRIELGPGELFIGGIE